MADQNDTNIKSGETPAGIPQAGAAGANPQSNNAPDNNEPDQNAPDFAKLADAASPEGSSINSEDYWFLKLNGNC
ncbi:MAG: hypothetical protein J5791_00765 [Fibrobacter sp.]|nr:hypothetical protein [Fibrobacter sp.]